ncbi:MAG: GNAT family N-acetyltransferase [Clostridiales bacterium]|nr:GNAT family N-acetyltransferase [Clostridiales bacterium]
MKTALEREFIACGRGARPMYADDAIQLIPRAYYANIPHLSNAKCLIFDIIDAESGNVAGELAIRVGDSPCMFYLGHIGYHIDPPYRGNHGAFRACSLARPLLKSLGFGSVVITTDVDNTPSIRTCEHLGCTLESVVDVPGALQIEYELSTRKRRYIWLLNP